MKNKTKKVRVSKRVVIGNAAVTSENLADALDFSKKVRPNRYEFLKVAMGIYPGAIVLSWAVKNLGFGEVTYYLQDGKFKLDSEAMSDIFVTALQKEVIRQHKNKKLEISYGNDLMAQLLERLQKRSKKQRVKFSTNT